MQQDFDQWQAQECQKLGLTKQEHDKLLELAEKMESVLPGKGAYDAIVAVMQERSIKGTLAILE